MADDWGQATITPPPQATTPPPQAAPAPASDDWGTATLGSPQAGPSPNQGAGQVNEDHVDDWLTRHPVLGSPLNLLAGAGAGVEEGVAGLDKLGRRITGTKMTGAEESLQRAAAAPTTGTAQAAGKIGENIGEFFTGEELLGMLGRTGSVMNAAEKLKAATGLANIANKVPMVGKLLRIGMDAVRSGTVGGAQELGKSGGDMGDAATTGGVTAATTAALGLAGLPLRVLAEAAPVKKFLESVPITALRSQVNKFGKYIPGTAEDIAPKIAEQQQQAAHQVIENVAAKATNTALDDINATRQATAPVSRQLGAPADAEPFTFNLGTTGETAAHPMSEEAAQAHRDTIEGLLDKFANPSLRKTITPEERAAWNEAHQALYGMEDTLAEGGEMQPPGATAGGAAASTTNPAEAVRWLQDREDLMKRPEWNDMPQAQKEQIQNEANQLRDQLGVYHSGYRQGLQPLDNAAITSQVHTFGHAAAQLRAAVQPVLDQVNDFTADKSEVKNLYTQMSAAQDDMINANTSDTFNAAIDKYQKANQGIQALVDKHRAAITPADYSAATKALGQAAKLGELHGVFENFMNGVTHEETEQGLSRVMTGNAKQFQGWLDKPGNTEMLDSLIGPQSRTNLKELTLLMSKAATNRNTATAAKDITRFVLTHGGGGAVAGYVLAPMFGQSHSVGAGEGAALSMGMKGVYRLAATNPRFGNSFVWAVRNVMDSEKVAPYLARMIMRRAPAEMVAPDNAQPQAAQGEQGGGEQ